MLRILIFSAILAGIAMAVPNLVDGSLFNSKLLNRQAVSQDMPTTATTTSGSGRRVMLDADSRGHFLGTFRINGRKVEGMIDTGASTIAFNRTTARKLGLSVTPAMFKHRVNTANGVVQAARVLLKTVELKSIRIRNVDAFVLDDKSLSGTLIGMTFLNRLGSYQIRGGKLTLTK